MRSFEKTLRNLGIGYLDLYLARMPLGDYRSSWRAMRKLKDEGSIQCRRVMVDFAKRLLFSGLMMHANRDVRKFPLVDLV
ncbi:MAG: hypothetical protein ACLSVD_07875 [Eggerthellaceae bacterium]